MALLLSPCLGLCTGALSQALGDVGRATLVLGGAAALAHRGGCGEGCGNAGDRHQDLGGAERTLLSELTMSGMSHAGIGQQVEGGAESAPAVVGRSAHPPG